MLSCWAKVVFCFTPLKNIKTFIFLFVLITRTFVILTVHCVQEYSHGTSCYIAICDRRILWPCRNLWLKVSQFVTGVAICDGKCRNLWQRQNMQFSDIYSPNFDKYFVLSSYLYLCETYFSHLSLNFVSSIIVFIHELFGHSNSLLMAHNSKSHNDVRCLQQ